MTYWGTRVGTETPDIDWPGVVRITTSSASGFTVSWVGRYTDTDLRRVYEGERRLQDALDAFRTACADALRWRATTHLRCARVVHRYPAPRNPTPRRGAWCVAVRAHARRHVSGGSWRRGRARHR